jgi:hypothetical protein
MADKIQKKTYYRNKTAGAPVDDEPVVIPNNTSWVIRMIDFTALSGNKGVVSVYWNGTGNTNIRASAQSDKMVTFPSGLELKGNNSRTLTIRLDNTLGTSDAWMGCIIYYEEYS